MLKTTKPGDWETHKCLQKNRLAGRSYFVPYAEKKAALSFERGNSPFFNLLNGVWKFSYYPTPAEAPQGFYEDSFDVGQWDDLQIPSMGIPITRILTIPFLLIHRTYLRRIRQDVTGERFMFLMSG